MNKIISDWVSIEERIPNFYVSVFVFTDENSIHTGYASEKNGVFTGFNNIGEPDYTIKGVTHWHPMTFPSTDKLIQ